MPENVVNIIIFALLLLIVILFALYRRHKSKKERISEETFLEEKSLEKKRRLSISDEEKNAIYKEVMKERDLFLKDAEAKYDCAFHPFDDFTYISENKTSPRLIKKNIGFYRIPKKTEKIAAFFFKNDMEYEKINAITLNINGTVSRRFEGFKEYMKARYFDIKEGDLITIEIEIDKDKDFVLNSFGVLVLKSKENN